jgi:hypothetical protein
MYWHSTFPYMFRHFKMPPPGSQSWPAEIGAQCCKNQR